MKLDVAFLNGNWVTASAAVLQHDDLGFVQGIVAVERLRTYGGELKHLPLYQTRLAQTLSYLHLDAETISNQFPSICTDLVLRNQITKDGSSDVSVVFTVTPGRPRSPATVLAHLAPLPWHRIDRLLQFGQSLRTPKVQQVPTSCWPRHLKIRARLQYYLADHEVQQIEPESEALLCDDDGTVTETSTGNILLVNGSRYCSPPSERVLPGVTLHRLKQLLEQTHVNVASELIHAEQMLTADEVIMTGSTSGVWQAVRFNGQSVGLRRNDSRQLTSATACSHLQSLWYNDVGIDLREQARRNASLS